MRRATKVASALAEKAGERLAERDRAGIHPNDILQEARATIISIARGHGGPRARERLQAAQRKGHCWMAKRQRDRFGRNRRLQRAGPHPSVPQARPGPLTFWQRRRRNDGGKR